MLRIHRGMDPSLGYEQFRGESVPELLCWIRNIILSVAYDLCDKAFADKRDVRREVHGSALLNMIAARSSGQQQALREELALELARAFDRLEKPRYRTAVELGILDGLIRAEAAKEMGISEGAFRVLLFRALSELRRDKELMSVAGESV